MNPHELLAEISKRNPGLKPVDLYLIFAVVVENFYELKTTDGREVAASDSITTKEFFRETRQVAGEMKEREARVTA
jgi:hypothetical protein